MNAAGQLLALAVDPGLDGAACKYLSPNWDPREHDEPYGEFHYRARLAARVCGTCPVIQRCAEVAESVPRRDRHGIWAGKYFRYGVLVPASDRLAEAVQW